LGYSLMWTGVAMKIAYFMGIISLGLGDLVLREALLAITATTSAFLDNLSVIVAFTPVAQSLVNIGISSSIYWALLFGGVLGGNFTPIGSTANIIAVGLCEKAKIKISWKEWLKLAFIATLLQVVIAGIWISI
ncbi:MAG: citrate transporter, partial [Desulfurococcaceae archaeon]